MLAFEGLTLPDTIAWLAAVVGSSCFLAIVADRLARLPALRHLHVWALGWATLAIAYTCQALIAKGGANPDVAGYWLAPLLIIATQAAMYHSLGLLLLGCRSLATGIATRPVAIRICLVVAVPIALFTSLTTAILTSAQPEVVRRELPHAVSVLGIMWASITTFQRST